jgi:hypothetical protein
VPLAGGGKRQRFATSRGLVSSAFQEAQLETVGDRVEYGELNKDVV